MPVKKKPFDIPGYEIADSSCALLGEGTYGTVFLAKETATGRHVAIKQHHNLAYEKGVPPSVLREGTLLKLLKNSPYVVRLKRVFLGEPNRGRSTEPICYMVFDLLECDLHNYALKHRPLTSEIIHRLMYHVLLGIHHCHVMGLMHRDLKPHNILMDTSDPAGPVAKLADFGFGRFSGIPIRPLTQEVITLWYRPPEVLLQFKAGHSPAVDIWSVACIMSELYETAILFDGKNVYEQMIKIFRLLGTPSLDVWPGLVHCGNWHEYAGLKRRNLKDCWTSTPIEAIDLLEWMLTYDPAKRPTAEECLRHRYFESLFNEADLRIPNLEVEDIFALMDITSDEPHPASDPVLLPSQSTNKFSGVFGKNPGSV